MPEIKDQRVCNIKFYLRLDENATETIVVK